MNFYIEYHENGLIKTVGEINEENRVGRWLYFYENGQIHKVINYVDGLEDGEWKSWHENGHVHVESFRNKGERVGVVKEYYENGKIKEIGEYEGGHYTPIDFWDSSNTQTLLNGTGKKIECYGPNDKDVYEFYYENRKFMKEVKISSYTYLGFTPRK